MTLSDSLISVVKILVAIAVLVTLVSFAGRLHFVLDNLSNFRLQFAIAFALAVFVLAISGERTWLVVSVVGLAPNIALILPWYFSGPVNAARAHNESAKLLVSNVYLWNTSFEKLSKLIATERPDIVGLIEVNSRFLQNVPVLHSAYPYRFEAPHDHYLGLALYSKLPLTSARIVKFGDMATPAIIATVSGDHGEVEFILAHPPPPMDAERAAQRNDQMRKMAEYVRQAGMPIVLAGDLNATMWSSYYRKFAAESGLGNARDGHGIGTTWPPLPGLGIPIDHIMATAELRLSDFRVLENIGSDHLPVSATLEFPDDPKYSKADDASRQ